MKGNGDTNGNGSGNGAHHTRGAAKGGDWFDEVLDTMDVMSPIALTDSFPIFDQVHRPEAEAAAGRAPAKGRNL
jgi:hypothetical protein